jgi:hypothetical protein
MRHKLYCAAIALCITPIFGLAQVPLRTINDARTTPLEEPPFDAEKEADSIVIFLPDVDIPLNTPEKFERTLRGRVVEVIKGEAPGQITFGADRFTRALKGGEPVRMYLMEYPETFDVYYPFLILEPTGSLQ